MEIYAVKVLLNEIVENIQEEKILHKPVDKIRELVKEKINSHLHYFCQNACRSDWFKVKNLGENIFELRIALNSDWLLRVLFLKEENLFLLFGTYLIKPKAYDDKHNKNKISSEYEKQITKLKKIYDDFTGECKLEYVDLTEYFNC